MVLLFSVKQHERIFRIIGSIGCFIANGDTKRSTRFITIGHGSAPYAHWAEILLLGIPSFLGPALVPGHITTYWLWFILRQLEAIETHSGYDFPWSPTKCIPFYGGPAYHDYHHYVGGRSQSNFASVFTYCDYIYGTHKGYQYRKLMLKKNSTYTFIAQNYKME
ncbi:Methylsterol monooxygenase 1-1 [Spatholobus suberectus]|nr:Methylsterol monooxygenase 1-1 [Spatholobus suberectus]